MKQAIVDWTKKQVGEVELDDTLFGSPVNLPLIYENIKRVLTNQRQGTVATRNTARMSGTTAKIYRQKGTGRARHGSLKRNIFVGGGVAFGPMPRDYRYSMSKKAKRSGVRAALSLKQKEGNIVVVDDFPLKEIKTKPMAAMLKTLGVTEGVIVIHQPNEMLEKSVRNIKNIKVVRTEALNAYDVVRYQHLVIMKSALPKLQEGWRP